MEVSPEPFQQSDQRVCCKFDVDVFVLTFALNLLQQVQYHRSETFVSRVDERKYEWIRERFGPKRNPDRNVPRIKNQRVKIRLYD